MKHQLGLTDSGRSRRWFEGLAAHEVAHQWWGHQIAAANVQGDGFIHETLAQYSAHDIEYPPQCVGPTGKCRREFRFEKTAIRDSHIDELVEAVIKKNVWVE